MTEDKFDEQIRDAATARDRASERGGLDLERVSARANTIRRHRSAYVTGATVLGLAVVIGGVYAAQGSRARTRNSTRSSPT
jgi:hypothetical protein